MVVLARVLMQIPEPKLHYVRYYGYYSSVARGRRRMSQDDDEDQDLQGLPKEADGLSSAERRQMRQRWAQLIKRVYEVDPLVCERCGSTMRIISVILDPDVIKSILSHLKAKGIAPGRGPPEDTDFSSQPPS